MSLLLTCSLFPFIPYYVHFSISFFCSFTFCTTVYHLFLCLSVNSHLLRLYEALSRHITQVQIFTTDLFWPMKDPVGGKPWTSTMWFADKWTTCNCSQQNTYRLEVQSASCGIHSKYHIKCSKYLYYVTYGTV